MEHQTWSHVRRIRQQQVQPTYWLVNFTAIDWLIENTQRMKQSAMVYEQWVCENAASEQIDLDADEEYDTFIGKISQRNEC